MPTKRIPNVPIVNDDNNEIVRPKVFKKDWERYQELCNRLRKFKVQGFLGELIDHYEQSHCPECGKSLDTIMCKVCGKGGTI